MARKRWKAFPHPDSAYDYAGPRLKAHWARLHQGDREPYPTPAELERLAGNDPLLAPSGRAGLRAAATHLEDAWRAYHRGDFGAAVELGLAVGPLGYNVANKAANIYATYLEPSEPARLALFLEVAERALDLQSRAPAAVNAWYFHAQALGRYSQGISIAKALAQGLAGRVRASLDATLQRDPRHADAHIALGSYHAEILHKVGATLGKLTYGVSKEDGVRHFEEALRLNPHSAIARVEFGCGLAMMYGKEKLARATQLLEEAAGCLPADAMERLDVERARSELQD